MSKIHYHLIAVFVNFAQANYTVTEPSVVTVDVELSGILSFPVNVLIEVNDTASTGVSCNFLGPITIMIIIISFLVYKVSELDFIGELFNLTFTGAEVHSVNISIVDDQFVEVPELIQLVLTPLTPGMILSDLSSSLIMILDNDGESRDNVFQVIR